MSDDTVDKRAYYLRSICMYMDLTKDTLLRLFKHLIKSENITKFLIDVDIRRRLRKLFKDDVLNKSEFNIVSSSWPEPEKFDIALLIRLILGLCRNRIAEPQLGWQNKPQPNDESLGADLIRLRNIRNKLIGHQACATLDKAEYNHIWEKMEAILIRVVKPFDEEATNALKEKLNEYKDLPLEAENGKIKRYLTQLKESDQETKRLQKQVEELLQKSKEFKTYFKTTPERFIRYVKLLFDGGSTVLCGVLERELRGQNRQLDSLISENEEILLVTIEKEYHSFLFPLEHRRIDYKGWDVGLLASVILLLFTNISSDDANDIEVIQAARNNYAKHAISCLDTDEFLDLWTDLIKSLTHLSMSIEEEIKKHVETLITRYKKKCNERDADDYLDQLRKSGAPVKTLKGVYDETMYLLTQKLRQLKERGIQFQCRHSLDIKIMISCEDGEKKRSAEDFVERNLEASLRKSPDNDNFLKMETDMFIESLTTHPEVKLVGIKRGCIILTFHCSTLDGLLYLLDYVDGQVFQKRIRNISNELNYLYEGAFLLLGHVTLESLSSIQLAWCPEIDSEEGILLPFKCNSVEGMGYILDALLNGKTSNSLNSIADKLSDRLQETVAIDVSANLFEFEDVFKEAGKAVEGFRFKGRMRDSQTLETSQTTDIRELDFVTDATDTLQRLQLPIRSKVVDNDEDEGILTFHQGSRPDPVVGGSKDNLEKHCAHRLCWDFNRFERRSRMKSVLPGTEYEKRKQELKEYLVKTYRKTLKDRLYDKDISVIFGRRHLISPKTGPISSYRDIFSESFRLHKNIYIIGDEKRASTICLEIVSSWCNACVHILRNFKFVFMLSLSNVQSEVSVYKMIKMHLPNKEYAKTLKKILDDEPEKCLIILDGLCKWERNVNKTGFDFEVPERNMLDNCVVLTTADRRLQNFIETTFSGDILLYMS